MKTKVLVIFGIFLSLCSIFGATKEDIINYAALQEVCDSKTSVIFNSYRNTFTRLLRQKSLTEEQCNKVMDYLINSVGILNSKGVCSLSDLNNLTTSERNTVYSNLTAGANIIINAPTEGFESNNSSTNSNNNNNSNSSVETNNNTGNSSGNVSGTTGTSGISINKTDGTIDIYENGILIDKMELSQEKLTYTGPDKTNIYVIGLIVLFVITFAIYMMMYNKHTGRLRFVKNILMSVQIMSAFVAAFLIVIGPKIETLSHVVAMLSIETTDSYKEVVVTQDKNIIYPSYGFVYGKIICDRLEINADVAFGDSSDILENAIGTASWSSLPMEGKNIVLSGHNSKELLRNLENVQVGDEFVLDTSYAKCTYEVYDTSIIEDTEVDKVKVEDNEETLVLYTCYPFSDTIYSNKRFVVYLKLQTSEWK